jgi:mono/diheme cytochrome c family protein
MVPSRALIAVLAACSTISTAACARSTSTGDAERGRRAFIEYKCTTCHDVVGEKLPPASVTPAVTLGGRVLLPPSEEKLKADITLPSSHFAVGYPSEQIMKDGKSRMPDYSKVLKGEQVADLVAYLRTRYKQGLPSATQ